MVHSQLSRIADITVEEDLLPFLYRLLRFPHTAFILIQNAGHTVDFAIASLRFLIGVVFPESPVDSVNKSRERIMPPYTA